MLHSGTSSRAATSWRDAQQPTLGQAAQQSDSEPCSKAGCGAECFTHARAAIRPLTVGGSDPANMINHQTPGGRGAGGDGRLATVGNGMLQGFAVSGDLDSLEGGMCTSQEVGPQPSVRRRSSMPSGTLAAHIPRRLDLQCACDRTFNLEYTAYSAMR